MAAVTIKKIKLVVFLQTFAASSAGWYFIQSSYILFPDLELFFCSKKKLTGLHEVRFSCIIIFE